MKKAAVVICVYNRASFVERCVDSVLNQDFENYEIVIVDDGSTDGTGAIVERFAGNKKVKLLKNRTNSGLMASRNKGALEADAEIIAFIDSDSVAERSWLREITGTFEADKRIAIAGGEILDTPGNNYWNLVSRGMYRIIPASGYTKKIFGGNMAARREFLLRYRFDETLKYGADEKDLCWRALKDNYKIYFQKSAKVTHFARDTFMGTVKQRFLTGAGNSYCSLKNRIPPYLYVKSMILLSLFLGGLFVPPPAKSAVCLFLTVCFAGLIAVEDIVLRKRGIKELVLSFPGRVITAMAESAGDVSGTVIFFTLKRRKKRHGQ